MSSIADVTDASFQREVVEADRPVLVEFWAPWCRPCIEMTSEIEEVSETFSGKVTVVKIRIDKNKQSAAKYDVDAPPTFLLFRDGKVFKRRTGKQSKESLEQLIHTSLSQPESLSN